MKKYIIQTIEANGGTWYYQDPTPTQVQPFNRLTTPKLATIFNYLEGAEEVISTNLQTYDLFSAGTIFIIIPIYTYGQ